tara:strand:- start:1011 stop:1784 length:774 start_codon:yes stop_codon:yes gene_type:complete
MIRIFNITMMAFFSLITTISSGIAAEPQASERLAIEIARNYVDITVGFTGTTVELFGDRRDKKTEIAIVIEGPKKDITIWKKDRVMGTWVNRYFVTYKDMPMYYHYAVSDNSVDLEKDKLYLDNGIGYHALLKNVSRTTSKALEDENIFDDILMVKKQNNGVFFAEAAPIRFMNDNFFRIQFKVPPSAPTGAYKIHSYLIRGGEIIQHNENDLVVKQVGLNAFLYNASRQSSFIYAMSCIFFALFSGWLVSVLKVRP